MWESSDVKFECFRNDKRSVHIRQQSLHFGGFPGLSSGNGRGHIPNRFGPRSGGGLPAPDNGEKCKPREPQPGSKDPCLKRGFTRLETQPSQTSWQKYIELDCKPSRSVYEKGTPHGHHIVPKTGPAGSTDDIRQAQHILCECDIDPFCGCDNLVVAQNHCHSKLYVTFALQRLLRARLIGCDAVKEALWDIALAFKECKFPGITDGERNKEWPK